MRKIKNMKEKITGIISILSSIIWTIIALYFLVESSVNSDKYISLGILVSSISVMLYVIWTNYSIINSSKLKKMDIDIQLLKKELEKKELEKKLNEYK
ncbi:hypothetical protein [Tenacibaculum singaporense]|uniref:hypothetical protein n=1 Tax=Tenacibaculum singaporense TaxID=2358479 RepID=UPI003516C0A5